MDAPAPAEWRPTLRQEWVFLAVMVGVVAAAIALQALLFPEAVLQQRLNPLSIVATLAMWFGHAGWITLDRRRRAREAGPWRFLAIFFGPLAIWIYLLLEYRLKGLALACLSLVVYALALGLGQAGAAAILLLTGTSEDLR